MAFKLGMTAIDRLYAQAHFHDLDPDAKSQWVGKGPKTNTSVDLCRQLRRTTSINYKLATTVGHSCYVTLTLQTFIMAWRSSSLLVAVWFVVTETMRWSLKTTTTTSNNLGKEKKDTPASVNEQYSVLLLAWPSVGRGVYTWGTLLPYQDSRYLPRFPSGTLLLFT